MGGCAASFHRGGDSHGGSGILVNHLQRTNSRQSYHKLLPCAPTCAEFCARTSLVGHGRQPPTGGAKRQGLADASSRLSTGREARRRLSTESPLLHLDKNRRGRCRKRPNQAARLSGHGCRPEGRDFVDSGRSASGHSHNCYRRSPGSSSTHRMVASPKKQAMSRATSACMRARSAAPSLGFSGPDPLAALSRLTAA